MSADLPRELRSQHYEIRTTDPVTGNELVGLARCDREPSPKTAEALQALLVAVAAAAREGTLVDESYE